MDWTVATLVLALTLAAPIGVVAAEQIVTPTERVASAPKGQLKSPYPDFSSVAEEGHRKYMAAGCNGCHGGGGGGGMAAPLTNPVWIYGDDDDTLFRLIALGTGKLSPGDAFGKLGYRRKGSENVVGRCRRLARSSRPMTTSGRSSPGSGRCIAGGERKDVERM
jgi:mono/diheme cytochrome c family protein